MILYCHSQVQTKLNYDLQAIEWTCRGVVPLEVWIDSLNAGVMEQADLKWHKWLNNTTQLDGFTSEHIKFVNHEINDKCKLLVESGLCPKIKIAFIKPLSLTGQNAVHSYICTTQIIYNDVVDVELFETFSEAKEYLSF
jgi:hypothetical protein